MVVFYSGDQGGEFDKNLSPLWDHPHDIDYITESELWESVKVLRESRATQLIEH